MSSLRLVLVDESTAAVVMGDVHLVHFSLTGPHIVVSVFDEEDNYHSFQFPHDDEPVSVPVERIAYFDTVIGEALVAVSGDDVALAFRDNDCDTWGYPYWGQLTGEQQ